MWPFKKKKKEDEIELTPFESAVNSIKTEQEQSAKRWDPSIPSNQVISPTERYGAPSNQVISGDIKDDSSFKPLPIDVIDHKKQTGYWEGTKKTAGSLLSTEAMAITGGLEAIGSGIAGKGAAVKTRHETPMQSRKDDYLKYIMNPFGTEGSRKIQKAWDKTAFGQKVNEMIGGTIEKGGKAMSDYFGEQAKLLEEHGGIEKEYLSLKDQEGEIDYSKFADPKFYAHQMALGTGSMVPALAVFAATKNPAAMGMTMGLMEKGDAFQTYTESMAKRKGVEVDNLTPEDIQEADEKSDYYGVVSGSLETIMPAHTLSRLGGKTVPQGWLKQAIKEVPKETLRSVVVEGGTEGTQRFTQNAIAKYSGINPDQNLTEGVLEEATTGAITGIPFGAGRGVATSMPKEEPKQEEMPTPTPGMTDQQKQEVKEVHSLIEDVVAGKSGEEGLAEIRSKLSGMTAEEIEKVDQTYNEILARNPESAKEISKNKRILKEEYEKGQKDKPKEVKLAPPIEETAQIGKIKEKEGIIPTEKEKPTEAKIEALEKKAKKYKSAREKAEEALIIPNLKDKEGIGNGIVTKVKSFGREAYVPLVEKYRGREIVKLGDNFATWNPKNETLFVVALDDTKKTGKRFIDKTANNVETARKQIDYSLDRKAQKEKPKPLRAEDEDIDFGEAGKEQLEYNIETNAKQLGITVEEYKKKYVTNAPGFGSIDFNKGEFTPEPSPTTSSYYEHGIGEDFKHGIKGKGDTRFVESEKAKRVEFSGFEDYDFFIHKPKGTRGWRISEGRTGTRITDTERTQKEAIKKAERVLNEKKSTLDEAIKRSVKEYGISPRYLSKTKQPVKVKKEKIIKKHEENKSRRHKKGTGEREAIPKSKGVVQTKPRRSEEKPAGVSGDIQRERPTRVSRDGDGESRIRLTKRPILKDRKKLTTEEVRSLVKYYVDDFDEITKTEEQKQKFIDYEGIGGQKIKGRGALDEFYTPREIVEKMWSVILTSLPLDVRLPLKALEPSAGTGRFIYYAPSNIEFDAYEIDKTSFTINKAVNKNHNIINAPFESIFMDERGNKKDWVAKYDLVVGNPPYYARAGIYKGLGEEPRIGRMEEYFIKRALDLTKEGGIVAMVVPSSFLNSPSQNRLAEIAKLGSLEVAYRLPEKTFANTNVGTDIIIIKRDTETSPAGIGARALIMSSGLYFKENPQKVLGEVKTRKNRYGKEEQYIEGDLEKELSKIEGIEDLEVEADIDIDKNTQEDIEDITLESKENKVRKEVKARRATTESYKRRKGKKEFEHSKAPQRLKKTPYIVKSTKKNNRQEFSQDADISEDEKSLYVSTMEDGSIREDADRKILEKYANYYNGKYYTGFNYFSGDIYEKLSQLEKDKNNLTEEQYKRQKEGLEKVKPKLLDIKNITINPLDEMAQREIRYSIEGEESKSLIDHFQNWIRDLPFEAFEGLSSYTISNYVTGIPERGGSKEENARNRQKRRVVGNKLFTKFYQEEIPEKIKKKIVKDFNEKYNSFVKPDYSKYPLSIRLSKDFYGKKLTLKDIQKEGASFILNKGVGIIAYDVGVGKTLTAIAVATETIRRGWAKRPLIVVPKSVKTKWVEDVSESLPGIEINLLENLGGAFKYKGSLKKLNIKENTITIMTEEGFTSLGYEDEVYKKVLSQLHDVTFLKDDKKKSIREGESEKERWKTWAGFMRRGTKDTKMEDLQFDQLIVDEAHRFKNIFTRAKAEKEGKSNEYSSLSGSSSIRGLKMYVATQYILDKFGGRNVLLLTATPFTNSPIEIYSMLSLVAKKKLERLGILNINDFINKFVDIESKLAVKANGTLEQVDQVRRFHNLQQLQKLVTEFIDFRTGEEAGIVRPKKIQLVKKIRMTSLQQELFDKAQEIFRDPLAGTLKGIDELQKIGLSPALSQFYTEGKESGLAWDKIVEESPKIKYVIESIKKAKKINPYASHIIYAEKGIEIFRSVRLYLINKGIYKENEVGILDSGASTQKERIQTAFQNGEVKVLFASPTAKEGIDLQKYSTDLYILRLPWNPTDLLQIEGRTWRQGSYWDKVRVHYPLLENSNDSFIFQKLEEKASRLKNVWSYKGDSVDVSDINFEEEKFELISDPMLKIAAKEDVERLKLKNEIAILKSRTSFISNRIESVINLKNSLDSAKKMKDEALKDKNDENVKYYTDRIKEYETRLVEERKRLETRGVELEKAEKEVEKNNEKINKLEEELGDLYDKYEKLREVAREKKETERKSRQEGDINDYEELTNVIDENGKPFYTTTKEGKVHTGKPKYRLSLKKLEEKVEEEKVKKVIRIIEKQLNPNIKKLLTFSLVRKINADFEAFTKGSKIFLNLNGTTSESVAYTIIHEIFHVAKTKLTPKQRKAIIDHYSNLPLEEKYKIFDRVAKKVGAKETGEELYKSYEKEYLGNKEDLADELSNWDADMISYEGDTLKVKIKNIINRIIRAIYETTGLLSKRYGSAVNRYLFHETFNKYSEEFSYPGIRYSQRFKRVSLGKEKAIGKTGQVKISELFKSVYKELYGEEAGSLGEIVEDIELAARTTKKAFSLGKQLVRKELNEAWKAKVDKNRKKSMALKKYLVHSIPKDKRAGIMGKIVSAKTDGQFDDIRQEIDEMIDKGLGQVTPEAKKTLRKKVYLKMSRVLTDKMGRENTGTRGTLIQIVMEDKDRPARFTNLTTKELLKLDELLDNLTPTQAGQIKVLTPERIAKLNALNIIPQELAQKEVITLGDLENVVGLKDLQSFELLNLARPTVQTSAMNSAVSKIIDEALLRERNMGIDIENFNKEVKRLYRNAGGGKLLRNKTLDNRLIDIAEKKGDITPTPEEQALVDFITQWYADSVAIMKPNKLRKNYFTHTRASFLENAKKNGLSQALKNFIDQNILDDFTKNLPKEVVANFDKFFSNEKFNPFALRRKGNEMSRDFQKAISSYARIYYFKKHLDPIFTGANAFKQVLPVHIQRWFNRVMQSAKGRPEAMNIPRYLKDAINTAVTVEYIKILGLNVASATTNVVWGNIDNFVAMGLPKYLKGHARYMSPKGFEMIERSRITSQNVTWEMAEIAKKIPNTVNKTIFILMAFGEHYLRGINFLGQLTKAEWKAGKISDQRWKEIYREIGQAQPIYGRFASPVAARHSLMKPFFMFMTWLPTRIENWKNWTIGSVKTLKNAEGFSNKVIKNKDLRKIVRLAALIVLLHFTLGGYKRWKREEEELKGLFSISYWFELLNPKVKPVWKDVENLSKTIGYLFSGEEYKRSGYDYERGEKKWGVYLKRAVTPTAIKRWGKEKGMERLFSDWFEEVEK